MKAKILGFKRSRSKVYNNYCIIELEDKNLARLVGRRVFWISKKGSIVSGKILKLHGKNLLVRFKRGLPGDALGSEIDVR